MSWLARLWRGAKASETNKEGKGNEENVCVEDGWTLLLGEKDNFQSLYSKIQLEARKRELEIVAHEVRRYVDKANLDKIVEKTRSTNSSCELINENLNGTIRLNNLKQVIKQWGEKERIVVSSKIFWSKVPKDSEASATEVWNDFNMDWPSSYYSQGYEGSMISYAFLAYSGGLTVKRLRNIITALTKNFQSYLSSSLYINLSKSDLLLIEESITCIISSLLQKHIEAAKSNIIKS